MRLSASYLLLPATACVLPTLARPGLNNAVGDSSNKLARRHHGWNLQQQGLLENLAEDSQELLGDLLTVGPVSSVGKQIATILTGALHGDTLEFDTISALSNAIYTTAVPTLGSAACKDDTCCVWNYIAAELKTKYAGSSGRCSLPRLDAACLLIGSPSVR
jgi:hypothetical protein